MKTNKIKPQLTERQRQVIAMMNVFNHISARDCEEIMEWLNDLGYLSEEGKCFKTCFWETFIKGSKNKIKL